MFACVLMCVCVCVCAGKARGFFRVGDMVIVVTGWSPGSGHTNTMSAVTVP